MWGVGGGTAGAAEASIIAGNSGAWVGGSRHGGPRQGAADERMGAGPWEYGSTCGDWIKRLTRDRRVVVGVVRRPGPGRPGRVVPAGL
ncbi:hypothetical protein GCM10009612_12210 [Streptomyces beijiangensis]